MKIFLFILMDLIITILIVGVILSIVIYVKTKQNAKHEQYFKKKTVDMFKNQNLKFETEDFKRKYQHIDEQNADLEKFDDDSIYKF